MHIIAPLFRDTFLFLRHDYAVACPLGFYPLEGSCIADSAVYAGPCSEYPFPVHLDPEKAEEMERAW